MVTQVPVVGSEKFMYNETKYRMQPTLTEVIQGHKPPLHYFGHMAVDDCASIHHSHLSPLLGPSGCIYNFWTNVTLVILVWVILTQNQHDRQTDGHSSQ